jgi:hypothetical protein
MIRTSVVYTLSVHVSLYYFCLMLAVSNVVPGNSKGPTRVPGSDIPFPVHQGTHIIRQIMIQSYIKCIQLL